MKYYIIIVMCFLFLVSCQKEIEPQVDVIGRDLTIILSIEENFIELPTSYAGLTITWESSDSSVINSDGQVSRVIVDTPVTLTAYYVFENQELSKIFNVIVKGMPLSAQEMVDFDYEELTLPTEISSNISLLQSGTHETMITWTSSMPYVISKSGVYYAPIDETVVTLVATIRFEDAERTKTFEVIALAMPDQDKVDRDYLMLDVTLPNPLKNLVLPQRGYFTSDITWESSHPEIIDQQGIFIKPIGSYTVILTATIKKGDAEMNKTFEIEVQGYDPEQFRQELRKSFKLNHGIEVIFGDIVLPTQVLDIAHVTWQSSHPEILSNTGHLIYPDQTTQLELTANITSGSFEDVITFNYTIYGKNDHDTEYGHQQLSTVIYDPNSLFYLDEKEGLTRGTFDNLIYRNERLILNGGSIEGTYTSPIIHCEYDYQRINLMWGSITHYTAKTELYTRYLSSQGWSVWFSHGQWGYGGDNLPPTITINYPVGVSDIQYQVVLTRDHALMPSPELQMVSIQAITNYAFNYTMDGLRTYVQYVVPQLKQADTLDASLWSNICWATSISMMLQYYGKLTDLEVPQEYYSVLIRQGTERFGTTKNDIGATQFGVKLHELEFHSSEMLLHVIDHFGPLVVGVSKGNSTDGKFGPLTYSSGHVIVVVGYEILANGTIEIIVNDPAVSWMRYAIRGTLDEFMLVWDHGGMLMQVD
jgi:hypothetical protein